MNLQVLLPREKFQESPVAATIVQPLQLLRSPSGFKPAHNLDEIVELEKSWCVEWIAEFLLGIDDGIRAPASIVVGRVEACGVNHGTHELKGAIEALKQLKSHGGKRRSLLPDTLSTAPAADAARLKGVQNG